MSNDVLRLIVGILAVIVAGASTVTAARYLWAAYRLGRTPGRILARHVAEVALGTTGLVIGYASAIGEQQLGADVTIPRDARTYIYLVSMLLLLTGLVEISVYQTMKARAYPQHREQIRAAVRAAIDRHRVTGPRSADLAAVLATNAVLELEGTPPLPVPEDPPQKTLHTPGHGRHALPKDRRTP